MTKIPFDSGRLREGLPLLALAAISAAALAWMILSAEEGTVTGVRGSASIVLEENEGACTIKAAHAKNVLDCAAVARDRFQVTFRDSLEGASAFVSTKYCCPASAYVSAQRTILIELEPETRYPLAVSILAR